MPADESAKRIVSPALRPALIVAALACVVYANTLGNGFVYDDAHFVIERHDFHTGRELLSLFAQDVHGLYRPVRSVVYAVVGKLVDNQPLGWRLFVLLLNAAACALAYRVARGFANERAALLAALWFTAHPVHTERVDIVTGGMDLTGITLLLATLAAALRAGLLSNAPRSRGWTVAAAALCVAAVFASEEAVLLPAYAALLLLWRWRAGEAVSRRNLLALFGALSVVGLYLAARTVVLGQVGRAGEYPMGSFAATLYTMGRVLTRYFRLLIAPAGLHVDYTVALPPPQDPLTMLGWLTAIVLATIGARLLWDGYAEGAAILWFFTALGPFMNLLPAPNLVGERYLFVPSLGAALLAGMLVDRALTSPRVRSPAAQRAVLGGFAVWLIALALLTVARNRDYRDDCALFANNLRYAPASTIAHNNLAGCLAERGDAAGAERHWRLAVLYGPRNARARYNLALLFERSGRHGEAVGLLREAIAIDPGHGPSLILLGRLAGEGDVGPLSPDIAGRPEYLVGRATKLLEEGAGTEADALLRRALADARLSAKYREFAAALAGAPRRP
jgi:hypothetical protein